MSAVGALGIISVVAALVTWAVVSMVAKDTGTRSATALSTTAVSSANASGAASTTTPRPTMSTTTSSARASTADRTEGPGAVTGISLACVRSADKVVATLTFDSPTGIISMVRAGEIRTVTNHAAGHITTTAQTPDLQATCLGVVGSRSIGPIPAS